VWSTLLRLGIAADQFVLWNAFPWHSFDARAGMLSNRIRQRPNWPLAGPHYGLSSIFSGCAIRSARPRRCVATPISVARAAPSSGGAAVFRQQIASLLSGFS
jgi:hypothetical protein